MGLGRGDRGDRGVGGERGPKGDHGQTGDVGPEGPAGQVVHDEARERKRDRQAFYRAAQLLALPVAILAALPGLLGIVLIQREVDEQCRIATENRVALRTTLKDAARRSATSKQRTIEEKKDAKRFYDEALKRLPPNPC